MGNTGEKLTKVAYTAGKDYYQLKIRPNEMIPGKWVLRAPGRQDRRRIFAALDAYRDGVPAGEPGVMGSWYAMWYVMLGPKPSKKWGPVCP